MLLTAQGRFEREEQLREYSFSEKRTFNKQRGRAASSRIAAARLTKMLHQRSNGRFGESNIAASRNREGQDWAVRKH